MHGDLVKSVHDVVYAAGTLLGGAILATNGWMVLGSLFLCLGAVLATLAALMFPDTEWREAAKPRDMLEHGLVAAAFAVAIPLFVSVSQGFLSSPLASLFFALLTMKVILQATMAVLLWRARTA